MTNARIPTNLIPNINLKKLIQDWKKKNNIDIETTFRVYIKSDKGCVPLQISKTDTILQVKGKFYDNWGRRNGTVIEQYRFVF